MILILQQQGAYVNQMLVTISLDKQKRMSRVRIKTPFGMDSRTASRAVFIFAHQTGGHRHPASSWVNLWIVHLDKRGEREEKLNKTSFNQLHHYTGGGPCTMVGFAPVTPSHGHD